MQLAALGLFVFEIGTFPFSEVARRSDWRHARSNRVGARDASQFVGPGDDSVTINGCLYPGVAGSFTAIDTLRSMAEEGGEYSLVDGAGRVLGSFVIVSMDERGGYYMENGVPRKKDFALDLQRVT